ncbi:MAG: recombinase family protein [Oscillospiraceae bacterium]|nr:recombinase family protein [Oscillospiraceae bacterium]
MINSEEQRNIMQQKDKIRARYKNANKDNLEIIPATPTENFHEDKSEKRVAVYARVSTGDPRQTSSYELQKNYYRDAIDRHPSWKLSEIYADEGITGTSLHHRDAFIKMIRDCKEGKIDLIITKSVSRFARNVLDCIGHVRELKALQPPIGVFFETENIYTLDPDSEMGLSFIATLAQEESHNKSKSMDVSIEMRFSSRIYLTPTLLGYDHDEDGNLIINEEEAKTVRLIFFMYLYGYTCQQIADTLSSLGQKTKKKNTQWAPGSILQILQNERHCGDILARKTWTPSYLNHKSRKNRGNRNQYRDRGHHEAIISRDDFIAVQHLISNAKYGNRGILPDLQVIAEGALKGFVSINPRWAGFSAEDYICASRSICNLGAISDNCIAVEAQSGDFDLRGYEIARSQFFDSVLKPCVTFSSNELKFGAECIRKMNNISFVEMLLHPDQHLLAVRPTTSQNRNAIRWAVLKEETYQPRTISGAAFLKTIYEIYGWEADCKYRIRGIRKQNDDESVYVFDMRETEIFIPSNSMGEALAATAERRIFSNIKPLIATSKSICAYPAQWAENFGSDYYRHAQAQELLIFSETGEWNIQSEGQAYNKSPLHVTSGENLKIHIAQIIEDIRQNGG